MAGGRGGGAAIEGVSDLRFRLRTLKIGISVSHGMCLAIGVYAASPGSATPDVNRVDARPRRRVERRPLASTHREDRPGPLALARTVDERMAVQHEHSSAVAGYSAASGSGGASPI